MRRARAIASDNRDAFLALLLIAAVFAIYAPALGGDRVWDDDAHITVGALQGLDGLRRIWFEPGATQQYYPVLHSAFWLEHRLWGEALPGYHAVTVLLHALAALLLVLLGQRAGVRGAWIGAYLFALHPVNAESVAWISEQKNTLSLVFALLASLVWLQYDASRLRRHWVAALALFLLALGSKTVTATLPAVLLVLTWWRRGRIEWRRDVVPLLPWLAVGVAAGLGTAWIERHVIGAVGAEFVLSPLQRLLLAGRASWHYLTTFLWPTALVFMYPRWVIDARDPVAYLYPASYLALLAACWRARHASRAPLAALLAFTGMLFPVLGFLDVYPFRYSFVADHFQYQATIPLAMLAGAAISWTYERAAAAAGSRAGAAVAEGAAGAAAPRLLALAVGGLLCALGVLTWQQAGTYRDSQTLYRAILLRNPASWMAHHNLARLLARRPAGLEEAIAHFELALALKPDHARAHYSLGVALQRTGRGTEAVPHFKAAIRLEPNNAPLVSNSEYLLGVEAMRRPGGAAEAVARFEAALRLKPGIGETEQALADAKRRAAADAAASASSPRSR